MTGTASYYGPECCKFNKFSPTCPTANGESLYTLEAQGVRYAAMWGKPFNTRLKVTNLANGKSTIVIVKDRGPHKRLKRAIDLSRKAFAEIADPRKGLIEVKIETIGG